MVIKMYSFGKESFSDLEKEIFLGQAKGGHDVTEEPELFRNRVRLLGSISLLWQFCHFSSF